MRGVLDGVHQAIGNTPMVNLSRLTGNRGGRIVAKLEYLNPGFSKKDRPALQMITEAERSGMLSPGQTVVELTSGNTGTGLAIVCAIKGYPFVAVMSRGNSVERARMVRGSCSSIKLPVRNRAKYPEKILRLWRPRRGRSSSSAERSGPISSA